MDFLSNLRLRFLLLVLLASVPAVVLLYLNAAEQRETAVTEARQNARSFANLASTDQSRLIESSRQLLTVLAQVPEVQNAESTECDEFLADLLEEQPRYANLGVIRSDGTVACTALPISGSLDLSDRSYFQRAMDQEDFAVGDYQVGRITDTATINAGYPLRDASGQITGIVYAALDLNWINTFVSAAQLPEGAVLTIFDDKGTIIVRSPPEADLIGVSAIGTPIIATAIAQPNSSVRLTDISDENGQSSLYAFAPLGSTEAGTGMISVAIPRATAEAAADRNFNQSLTRLGLVILTILAAAWVGGDLLVRRNTEANKALVNHLYDAFDTGGVDLLDEVVDPQFIDHNPIPGQSPNLAGLKQVVGLFRAAFPDGEIIVDSMVAEKDRVVTQIRISGTQMGDFANVPASHVAVVAEGMEAYRIASGKIVEGWSRLGPTDGSDEVFTFAADGMSPPESKNNGTPH